MCNCCNGNYYGESKRHFYFKVLERLDMATLRKNLKKLSIFDYIMVETHDSSNLK